jgi:hypothetical protein
VEIKKPGDCPGFRFGVARLEFKKKFLSLKIVSYKNPKAAKGKGLVRPAVSVLITSTAFATAKTTSAFASVFTFF